MADNADLNHQAAAIYETLSTTSGGRRTDMLIQLGQILSSRYQQLMQTDGSTANQDLDKAIAAFTEAHDLMIPSDPRRRIVAGTLGHLLATRQAIFENENRAEDRDLAILMFHELLAYPDLSAADAEIGRYYSAVLLTQRALPELSSPIGRSGDVGMSADLLHKLQSPKYPNIEQDLQLASKHLHALADSEPVNPGIHSAAAVMLPLLTNMITILAAHDLIASLPGTAGLAAHDLIASLSGMAGARMTGALSVLDRPVLLDKDPDHILTPNSTTTVSVTIYLDDEAVHEQVESALEDLLATAGLHIEQRDDPILGSWFRRMRAAVHDTLTSPSTQDVAMTIAHAAESRIVLYQDATVTAMMMQNLGPVIAALQPTKDAVIRAGALLIVKVDWGIAIHQLTAAQQLLLDHQPHLALSPHDILRALRSDADETPTLAER